MKKSIILYFLILISCNLISQTLNNQNEAIAKSQKFIIPEKLWKTDCQGMAQNIVIQRLPDGKGSMSVALAKLDTSVSILTGNICDMVRGYNNSSFSIGSGRYKIKPCEGSAEKDIEILSQGLAFIYHTGIGLEYISGNGTINMFDKLYELPIDEWKIALKEDKIDGYKKYVKNNPTGEHAQDALSKIETLSYEQCIKYDRYYRYSQFIVEFPESKYAIKIKNKLLQYKKIVFSKDTIISENNMVQKYHWNKENNLYMIDDQGISQDVDTNGRTWATGNFGLGNLEFINAMITRVNDGNFIVKGSELVYKIPPKVYPTSNKQTKPTIKKLPKK